MIRFVVRTYPPCWVLKARIQKHRGKPLLFHDKCPGFFYVHYTTHRTYSFTSHPKDEAIMVKCLAQGHKRRNRPGWDSNPHSGNTRTWVQCTRPLGHNTPHTQQWYYGSGILHDVCLLWNGSILWCMYMYLYHWFISDEYYKEDTFMNNIYKIIYTLTPKIIICYFVFLGSWLEFDQCL